MFGYHHSTLPRRFDGGNEWWWRWLMRKRKTSGDVSSHTELSPRPATNSISDIQALLSLPPFYETALQYNENLRWARPLFGAAPVGDLKKLGPKERRVCVMR